MKQLKILAKGKCASLFCQRFNINDQKFVVTLAPNPHVIDSFGVVELQNVRIVWKPSLVPVIDAVKVAVVNVS
jgi:hypothetical protein